MRALLLLFAVLAVSGCASGPSMVKATMPLEILKDEGQLPRLGSVSVEAGGYGEEDSFHFAINFNSDGNSLGTPRSVSWQMNLGSYCRDQFSFATAVLIAPSGQVWRGRLLGVPAGPERDRNWSTGYANENMPHLLEAVAEGGLFTLAFEDNEGQRWDETVIDTLTTMEREKLFEANRAAVAAIDPATFPVTHEPTLPIVYMQDSARPPRPCPTKVVAP